MPEDKVGYGPDTPKLTPEQLAQFERASYLPKSEPASSVSVAASKRRMRGK